MVRLAAFENMGVWGVVGNLRCPCKYLTHQAMILKMYEY